MMQLIRPYTIGNHSPHTNKPPAAFLKQLAAGFREAISQNDPFALGTSHNIEYALRIFKEPGHFRGLSGIIMENWLTIYLRGHIIIVQQK